MTDVVVKILTGALLLSAVALTTTQAAAADNNNNVVQSSASSTSTFTSTETPADLLKSCNPLAMDRIIRWLFFFNEPNRVLPRNAKEFEEFCDEKSRKEVYVNAYARRCLGQFPRQVTSLLMFGVARQNRYYCSYTKGRNEIIQGAKCLNAIKEKGAKCMSTAINDMKAIKFAPTEGKIAKTCCTYYRLEECLVAKVQEEGNKACTPKDPKRMEELLEGYTGQMISHVCARFPKDVDHCAKVLPKRELNRLRKLAASAKAAAEGVGDESSKAAAATVEYKSILQPMIDILDSIPP